MAATRLLWSTHWHNNSVRNTSAASVSSHLGTPLDPRNALRSLTAAATHVGLDDVGLHALRHSAASALISSGAHLWKRLADPGTVRGSGAVFGLDVAEDRTASISTV